MFKKFLTYCSVLLAVGVLSMSHLNHHSIVLENLEAQDVEVKLEGEKEEVIAGLHLVELALTEFLYRTSKHLEPQLNDYIVYLAREDKPPRFFS